MLQRSQRLPGLGLGRAGSLGLKGQNRGCGVLWVLKLVWGWPGAVWATVTTCQQPRGCTGHWGGDEAGGGGVWFRPERPGRAGQPQNLRSAPGVRGERAEARLFQHAVSIAGGGGKKLRRCGAQGGEMGGGVVLKRRVGV